MSLYQKAAQLDRSDPLRLARERFVVPEGKIYLDGNSLGALPKHVPERIADAVQRQWGQDLISSWNKNHWIDLPQKVGAQLAALIGAQPSEVIACDSTSINVFKVLLAALKLRPERRVIVSDIDNFPTDLYIAQGIGEMLGGYELRFVKRNKLEAALTPDVAVLLLTEVDYRTGERLEMRSLTALAQSVGALTVWDLAHSAGAFPVELNGCNADFAIGCGYKYLNGGPGAPAFLFVAERHQQQALPALSGWMGHSAPFAFSPDYSPAQGILRMTTGTPPVLALTALSAALELWQEFQIDLARVKSLALTDLFIEAMQPLKHYGFRLVTPLEHQKRGSQVSYTHPEGFAIMQALIAAGVVGDFRAPDIMRFGFAPLYNSFTDVVQATQQLNQIMQSGIWQKPEFAQRSKVT
ncbi:MAG: kynureninase [Deinococcales bacterium]